MSDLLLLSIGDAAMVSDLMYSSRIFSSDATDCWKEAEKLVKCVVFASRGMRSMIDEEGSSEFMNGQAITACSVQTSSCSSFSSTGG
jgi:hypothetical protein